MAVRGEGSASRPARVARGVCTSAFAVLTASVSHVVAGGHAPGLVGIAIAFVFGSLLCVAVAGRRVCLPRTAVGIALSQLLLHALFSAGALTGAPTGAHQHGASGHLVLIADGRSGVVLDGGMLLGHAVAAALTILFWWRAERSFWELAEGAALRLVRALGGTVLDVPTRVPDGTPAPLRREPPVFRARADAAIPSRRGPPVFATV